MTSAYTRGRLARLAGSAFLTNPFVRYSLSWDNWQLGWLDEDQQQLRAQTQGGNT